MLTNEARQQWGEVRGDGIGPLRFGMSPGEAVRALPDWNPTFRDMKDFLGGTLLGEFRLLGHPRSSIAVKTYFADRTRLQCIALDALCGPQVSLSGVMLTGRPLHELETEMVDYARARGISLWYTPAGGASAEEVAVEAQCDGDILRSRPIFVAMHEHAATLWDSIPSDALANSRNSCQHQHWRPAGLPALIDSPIAFSDPWS